MSKSDSPPPEDSGTTETRLPPFEVRETIGPYRPLQKVGEGGMGEVWLAEQEKPIRRRVALKLIKAGMDTKQVVARFESERQALALMDHPSIAKVFDAGTTPEGRPYFAMEYVKGEPVTSYCDRHRLTTRDRLELFMRVCEGVQHAHQKGIIHRDIKASNVLVTVQEEKPVPKIIDFGVAKATEQRLTERTVYTQLGVLIGTPEYMSPEQAEMTGLDIDTRTDVYSLGVLLYELLTGVLPFDPKELRKSGFDEIRRKIREEEPSRPSTRVSTWGGEQATSLSTTHRVELPALRRQLKGDLDWITMKALEKDRTRRYQSATELAADIGRHLTSQPVLASPPSTAYRMGKFVRRHKVGVAAGAVVALALVLGIVGTTVGLVRAQRAEAQALRDAETATQVSDFLVGLFEVSDPSEARGNTITAREILDKGAERIRRELADDPEIRARLMYTIARVYRSLGLYVESLPLLEETLILQKRVLDSEHPHTLRTESLFASVLRNQDRLKEAERLLPRVVAAQRRVLGDDHADTRTSVLRQAQLYGAQGRFDEAETLLLEALDSAGGAATGDDLWTLSYTGTLAVQYAVQDRYEDSARLLEKALESSRGMFGSDHPSTVQTLNNLAYLYRKLRQLDRSERLYVECIPASERVFGEADPKTQHSIAGLADLRVTQGRFEEAERLLRDVLARARQAPGENPPPPIDARWRLDQLRGVESDLLDEEMSQEFSRAEAFITRRGGLVRIAYNRACFCALVDRRTHAVRYLRRAVDLGYSNHDWMLRDPDLESLHRDPDFEAIVEEAKKGAEEGGEASEGSFPD